MSIMYDITIKVGKNPYIKIFRLHMEIGNFILICKEFYQPVKRKLMELWHIKFPNILPKTFQIILR